MTGRKLSRIKVLTSFGGDFAKIRVNLPEKNTQFADIPKNRDIFRRSRLLNQTDIPVPMR